MIRPAQSRDLASIVWLDRHVPELAHWDESDYVEVINNEFAATSNLVRQILVAENTLQSISGFVLVKCILITDEVTSEIENLAVDINQRQQGTGRKLMEAAIAWARSKNSQRMHLEVRASNAAAIGLYKRINFVEVGVRRGYYLQPMEDAVLMDLVIV